MTNIKYMKKADLLELAEEGGIEIPEGATNPEIRKLLTAPPKAVPKKKITVPKLAAEPVSSIDEPITTELDSLHAQLAELESGWDSEPSGKRRALAKQNIQKIKDRIALLN